MTIKATPLWPSTQLGTSAGALYTSSVNGTAVIKQAVFTNTDTTTRTLTVYIVPSSGSPTTANILIDALPLSAGQAYVSPELSNQVIASGSSVQALCDVANKINSIGSGFTQ
jgi:hypothetical protein